MLPGLNGDGKKLASSASALAGDVRGDAGRADRVVKASDGKIYLQMLWRHEVRQLFVARADRVPSQEEALVALEAAGGPDGCEGLPGKFMLPSQDGTFVPVKVVRFCWTAEPVQVRDGAIGGGHGA